MRADSGFFDQALLAFLEERGLPYIIVARMTTQIKARLNSAAIHWREIAPGYAVGSFTAKLHGWADTRRFIVVREKGFCAAGKTLGGRAHLRLAHEVPQAQP